MAKFDPPFSTASPDIRISFNLFDNLTSGTARLGDSKSRLSPNPGRIRQRQGVSRRANQDLGGKAELACVPFQSARVSDNALSRERFT